MAASIPIHHLEIDGSTSAAVKPAFSLHTWPLVAGGNLTIDPGCTFVASGLDVSVAGAVITPP